MGRPSWALHASTRSWRTGRHTAIRYPVKGGNDGCLLWREVERDLLSLLRAQSIQKRGRGSCHLLGLSSCIFMLDVVRCRVNRTEVTAKRSYTQRVREHHNSQQTVSPSLRTESLFSDRGRSFAYVALAVIICRVTVNRMNVIGRLIVLRRVLDHEVRSLNAVVSRNIRARLRIGRALHANQVSFRSDLS